MASEQNSPREPRRACGFQSSVQPRALAAAPALCACPVAACCFELTSVETSTQHITCHTTHQSTCNLSGCPFLDPWAAQSTPPWPQARPPPPPRAQLAWAAPVPSLSCGRHVFVPLSQPASIFPHKSGPPDEMGHKRRPEVPGLTNSSRSARSWANDICSSLPILLFAHPTQSSIWLAASIISFALSSAALARSLGTVLCL